MIAQIDVALYSFAEFLYDYEYLKLNGLLRTVFSENALFFYLLAVVWIVLSYLLGAVNFSILLSKHIYHDDIRNYGSKNAGFTNMRRVFGKKMAILVMIGDVMKSVIAVAVAMLLFGSSIASVTGLSCILGHCFPCFYKFKGGKGVAATAGMVFVLDPVVFLILFVLFALIVLSTKYLSLGSIMSLVLYPLILRSVYNFLHGQILPQYFVQNGLYTEIPTLNGAVTDVVNFPSTLNHTLSGTTLLVAVFLAAFVVFMHRANIRRIWKGEENRFYLRKKPQTHAFETEDNSEKRSIHRIDALDDELKDNDSRK